MCKFLGTYNLTSTRHKKETLNRQIKSKMTESLMKSHPTKRHPGTDGLTAGFYQTPEIELTSIFPKHFQNTEEETFLDFHWLRLFTSTAGVTHSVLGGQSSTYCEVQQKKNYSKY